MKRCPECPYLNPRGSIRCQLCQSGIIGNHPEPRTVLAVLRQHPRRALLAALGVLVLSVSLWRLVPSATDGITEEQASAACQVAIAQHLGGDRSLDFPGVGKGGQPLEWLHAARLARWRAVVDVHSPEQVERKVFSCLVRYEAGGAVVERLALE